MSLKGMNEDRQAAIELIDMYLQFAAAFDADEIAVLNGVFQQCLDFYGIERTLPDVPLPAAPEPTTKAFSREVFGDIVRRELLDAKTAALLPEIQEVRELIEALDVPPETWQGTVESWKTSVKGRREKLAERRSELGAKNTRYKNGTLELDEHNALEKEIDVLFKQTDGVPDSEQFARYIKSLEKQSLKVVNGLDYYPTPHDIVARMLEKADIHPYMTVLEPSAGKGDILDAIKSRFGNAVTLDAVEYSDFNRNILELKGYNVVGSDFMQYAVVGRTENGFSVLDKNIKYDRIVMNPPYLRGMDWIHVQRAFELLRPNGKLVALVPAESYLSLSAAGEEKQLFISEHAGELEVIPKDIYVANMEGSGITIDIAMITLSNVPADSFQSDRSRTDYTPYQKYQAPIEKGQIALPERDPIKRDEGFSKPDFVNAVLDLLPKLSSIPDYVSRIKNKNLVNALYDHQREGANRMIHALVRPEGEHGFLLADGTGVGKTIQLLAAAAYCYQEYNKPVALFTIDSRVIRTSFMGDGLKMGFPAPEYTPDVELIIPNRPEEYKGLYGLNGLSDRSPSAEEAQQILEARKAWEEENKRNPLPTIYYGDEKTMKLKNGINMFTHNKFSLIKTPEEKKVIAEEKKNVMLSERFWSRIRSNGKDHIKDLRLDFFTSFGEQFSASDPKKEMYDAWDALVENARDEDTLELQDKFVKALSAYDIEKPPVERANVRLVQAEDKRSEKVMEVLHYIAYNTSLVIFDEAHKLKNLLVKNEEQALRAFNAKKIHDVCSRVIFATATPCDRPYDILYLKRAGLFVDDADFIRRMSDLGIYQEPEKRNKNGDIIRRAQWYTSKKDDEYSAQYRNWQLSTLFDFITRRGYMLRRELQLKNLEANFLDVIVPDGVKKELKQITEGLTKIGDDGRSHVNHAVEYKRHLERLEEYKLDEVIRITKREVAEGRNVIIFTSLVDIDTDEDGKLKERDDGSNKLGTVRILKNKLSQLYGDDAVGVLVSASKGYEDARRMENIKDFQSGKRRVLISTLDAGGTGVSLDDQVGNANRTMIIMTAPLTFINAVQGVGRVVRANSVSRSRAYFMFAKTDHPKNPFIKVESWLKKLYGNKFQTLNAIVKGEIGILNPETMRRVTSAGGDESAGEFIDEVATNDEDTASTTQDAPAGSTTTTGKEHTLYKSSVLDVKGWELPTKIPLRVVRSGNSQYHSVYISARTTEEFKAWEEANADFIAKWKLLKNPDTNYRRYNGNHYAIYNLHHINKTKWDETFDVTNAMLNLIKPEEFKFLVSEQPLYKEGDIVQTTTDILSIGAPRGASVKIVDAIGVKIGENTTGDIKRWEYDVEYQGRIMNNIPSWQLTVPLAPVVALYNAGEMYLVNEARYGGYSYRVMRILKVDTSTGEAMYNYAFQTQVARMRLQQLNEYSHWPYEQEFRPESEITSYITSLKLERYDPSIHSSPLGDDIENSRPALAGGGLSDIIDTPFSPFLAMPAPQNAPELPPQIEQDEQNAIDAPIEQGTAPTPQDFGFYDHQTIMNIRPTYIRLNRMVPLLEKIAKPFRMLVWGKQGSGKSSLTLMLAEDLSLNGKVLHVLTEEKISSGRIGERVARLQINARKIMFNDQLDYSRLREFLSKNDSVQYVIIDSVNQFQGATEQLLMDMWNEFPQVSFVFVGQSTKDGKTHSAFPTLAFNVDTVIKVEDLVATAEKHRDGRTGVGFSVLSKRLNLTQNKPLTFAGYTL